MESISFYALKGEWWAGDRDNGGLFIKEGFFYIPVCRDGDNLSSDTDRLFDNTQVLSESVFSKLKARVPRYELLTCLCNRNIFSVRSPHSYNHLDILSNITYILSQESTSYETSGLTPRFYINGGGYIVLIPGGSSTVVTTFYNSDNTIACRISINNGFNDYAYGIGAYTSSSNYIYAKTFGVTVASDGTPITTVWFNVKFSVKNTSSSTNTNRDVYIGSYNGSETHNEQVIAWLISQPKVIVTDPYSLGGTSSTGGGDGEFTDTGTPVAIPSLPTISSSNTGFTSIYSPTLAELNSLADYMWSGLFSIDTLKKLFADPMDVILGLSILPIPVPSSGVRTLRIGNISTGISMHFADEQYLTFDCGTIEVPEYWGGYLDYNPYTKLELFLPYIGTVPVSADDIIGRNINITYHIDILTGSCCAMILCGDTVLYQFIGQCASQIPITSSDWHNVINGSMQMAASLGALYATGGATAAEVAGVVSEAAVNSMKQNFARSGSFAGVGAFLGIQNPYFILTRPRQALPESQNYYTGYPSFITESLSELNGYTEIYEIHLENVTATDDELSEIEDLLKGGVIF